MESRASELRDQLPPTVSDGGPAAKAVNGRLNDELCVASAAGNEGRVAGLLVARAAVDKARTGLVTPGALLCSVARWTQSGSES